MTGPEVTQPDPDGGVEMTDGEFAALRGAEVTAAMKAEDVPTSEVARVLGEHPGWRFRAEEPGDWYVCSGCGTELETLRSAFPQEFYEHQATTLAEAGLLRDGGSR